MQLFLHQTKHTIGDFDAIFKHLLKIIESEERAGLHLFCELYLTGYPLLDLVVKKSFIAEYENLLKDLEHLSQTLMPKLKNAASLKESAFLFGGLKYTLDEFNRAKKIENVIYEMRLGQKLKVVHTKVLLANDDVFEEKKYYSAGEKLSLYQFFDRTFLLSICEDMWPGHLHDKNPFEDFFQQQKLNCNIDGLINISASPFHLTKDQNRRHRAFEISRLFSCPFIYLNRVGFEDDLIFDGQSFILNADGSEFLRLKAFAPDHQTIDLKRIKFHPIKNGLQAQPLPKTLTPPSSFLNLYQNRLDLKTQKLKNLSEDECQSIIDGLTFSLFEYAFKIKQFKFSIALSGGMDSALVLSLLKLMQEKYSTKEQSIVLEAIYMPSIHSNDLSRDLSEKLCQNLNIPLLHFPIKFLHSTLKNQFHDHYRRELQGLADENIQSRLRGLLLYARSNDVNTLVVNTSNKSELAVGYSTLYGDSVGALSPLGDLYKTEVFQLAHYINRHYHQIIPQEIITRPPSAELCADQQDSDSLPPYDVLDFLLESYLSCQSTPSELINSGFKPHDVEKVFKLLAHSEFKRRQFCPIIKLKPKSFGFGHRMPISKKTFS